MGIIYSSNILLRLHRRQHQYATIGDREDLLRVAEKDGSDRNWHEIRKRLAACIEEEDLPGADGGNRRMVYRVQPETATQLADECIYVEQGRSGKAGARKRPLFERMKRDAALRKFNRLLVWKVSRLGRDMREVIATVYELADQGVTVFPVKSQTGPITSTMGKLLWAIQAWYAEFENTERSEAIKAGHTRARAAGKRIGRPKVVFSRDQVLALRRQGLSWSQIASRLGVGTGTVRRAFRAATGAPRACQKPVTEFL